MHNLTGLYPDLEYPIWLAARSQRGEGATTPPIRVRTKPYGKLSPAECHKPLLFIRIGVKLAEYIETETEG